MMYTGYCKYITESERVRAERVFGVHLAWFEELVLGEQEEPWTWSDWDRVLASTLVIFKL